MIDAVIFDLDDTLCAYRRPAGEVLALAFADVGVEPFFTGPEYFAAFEAFAERGETVATIRERCFVSFAEEAGHDPAVGRALARAFEAERDQRNVQFRPGAREALDALAGEYSLGMVTNGDPETQGAKLDGLGIVDDFEAIVYAGWELPPKPDPAPFERVLEALGVLPENAVHVGNSLESDVAGARAAGLRSAWVPVDGSDPGTHSPDYVLDSLDALAEPPWVRNE